MRINQQRGCYLNVCLAIDLLSLLLFPHQIRSDEGAIWPMNVRQCVCVCVQFEQICHNDVVDNYSRKFGRRFYCRLVEIHSIFAFLERRRFIRMTSWWLLGQWSIRGSLQRRRNGIETYHTTRIASGELSLIHLMSVPTNPASCCSHSNGTRENGWNKSSTHRINVRNLIYYYYSTAKKCQRK